MPAFFLKLALIVSLAALGSLFGQAQSNESERLAAKIPKTIFRDSQGNLISNNEFVDLRLANPSEKDPATKRFTEDGDVEFTVAPPRQEGTRAPVFEAPTIDGKTINTDRLKGKVIVLNFWFIGCPGCLGEILNLNLLRAKFKDESDAVFVAIAPDTPQEIRSFTKQNPFEYELIGSARSLVNLFNFRGFPRNIVIGRDGRIAYWRTKVNAWGKFESVVREELEKN